MRILAWLDKWLGIPQGVRDRAVSEKEQGVADAAHFRKLNDQRRADEGESR